MFKLSVIQVNRFTAETMHDTMEDVMVAIDNFEATSDVVTDPVIYSIEECGPWEPARIGTTCSRTTPHDENSEQWMDDELNTGHYYPLSVAR